MGPMKGLMEHWKRVSCCGHFGADHKHKWWVVVLFWVAVAAAALALLTWT